MRAGSAPGRSRRCQSRCGCPAGTASGSRTARSPSPCCARTAAQVAYTQSRHEGECSPRAVLVSSSPRRACCCSGGTLVLAATLLLRSPMVSWYCTLSEGPGGAQTARRDSSRDAPHCAPHVNRRRRVLGALAQRHKNLRTWRGGREARGRVSASAPRCALHPRHLVSHGALPPPRTWFPPRDAESAPIDAMAAVTLALGQRGGGSAQPRAVGACGTRIDTRRTLTHIHPFRPRSTIAPVATMAAACDELSDLFTFLADERPEVRPYSRALRAT